MAFTDINIVYNVQYLPFSVLIFSICRLRRSNPHAHPKNDSYVQSPSDFFRQEKFMDWSNVIEEITEA